MSPAPQPKQSLIAEEGSGSVSFMTSSTPKSHASKGSVPKLTKVDPPSLVHESVSQDGGLLARCVSVRTLFVGIVVLLTAGAVIAGLSGFAYFLRSSISFSTEKRTVQASLLVEKVTKLMQIPKVITDGFAASLKTGSVNFTTTSLDDLCYITYATTAANFLRTGLSSMILWTANDDASRFVAYWATTSDFETATYALNRRHDSVDNTTLDELWFCTISDSRGLCPVENGSYVAWNRYGSITHTCQYYPRPQFVPPYSFYCPGPLCEVFFGFAHPFWSPTGEYDGGCGVIFPGLGLRNLLQTTGPGEVVFFVDLNTDRIVSTSLEIGLAAVVDDTDGLMLSALEHINPDIGPFVRHISLREQGNVSANLPTGVWRSSAFRSKFVDYYRHTESGADWLFVYHSRVLEFITPSLVFAAIFIAVASVSAVLTIMCGLCGSRLVSDPLRSLGSEIEKVKSMKLSEVVIAGKRVVSRSLGSESGHPSATTGRSTLAPPPRSCFLRCLSSLCCCFMCWSPGGRSAGWSKLWEVAKLQKQFCFLVEQLAFYRSFLPTHMKGGTCPENAMRPQCDQTAPDIVPGSSGDSASSIGSSSAENAVSDVESDSCSCDPSADTSSAPSDCLSLAPSASMFDQVLDRKTVTLCYIRWVQVLTKSPREGEQSHPLSPREFIEYHTLVSSTIAESLTRYQAVFVDISSDHFILGFNVVSHLHHRRDATCYAARFLLDVLRRIRLRVGGPFELSAAICTGPCFSGVLGCVFQKGLVVQGVIRDRVEEMAVYAGNLPSHSGSDSEAPIVVDSPTFARLNPAHYHLEPIDMCLFKNLELSVLYMLRKLELPRSQEWMYVVSFESKQKEHQELLRVWKLFQAGHAEECLQCLETLPQFKEISSLGEDDALDGQQRRRKRLFSVVESGCLQMKATGASFLEWARATSQARMQALQKGKDLSLVFQDGWEQETEAHWNGEI